MKQFKYTHDHTVKSKLNIEVGDDIIRYKFPDNDTGNGIAYANVRNLVNIDDLKLSKEDRDLLITCGYYQINPTSLVVQTKSDTNEFMRNGCLKYTEKEFSYRLL